MEKTKRPLLKFGRRGKVNREATWHSMSSHTKFDLDLVYGWIWNLRIPIMFIKYRDHP